MTQYQDYHTPEQIRRNSYSYGQTHGGGDIKGLFIALAVICLVVAALAVLFSGAPKTEATGVSQSPAGSTAIPISPADPQKLVE